MANFGQMKQYHMGPQQGAEQAPPPPPKPPRKNPYSDGIATSAQHYDLYEMIRNPSPGRAHRLPDPPTPGELYERSLSKQRRIERDIEKSFRANNCQLPGNRFAQTGKLLKYLFFMIALPPYLLLYLLPKTLFFVMLPAAIKAVDSYLVELLNRLGNAINRGSNRIKAFFLSFWEEILKLAHTDEEEKVKEESADFFSFIAKGFVLIYRILIGYPIAGIKFAVNGVQTLYKEIRAIPGRVRAWKEAQKRRLEQFVLTLAGYPKKVFQKLKEALRERFVDKPKRTLKAMQAAILGKINAINAAINRKGEAVESFFRTSYAKVRGAIVGSYDFVSGGPKHWLKTIKEGRDALAKHIRQKLKEAADRFYNAFIAPIVKAYASFKAKAAAVNKAIEKRMDRVQEAAGKARSALSFKIDYKERIAALSSYANHKAQPFRSFAAAVRRQYKGIAEKAAAVKVRIAAPFVRAGKAVDEAINAAVARCNKTLEPVKSRCAAAKAKIDRAVMRIRLCVAWSRVLLRYAMRQTEELVQSFF